MSPSWTKFVAPAVSVLLVLGLWRQIRTYAAVDDTTSFHAAVREAMAAYPYRMGTWEGVDIPLPQAAQALLRPNVLFARRFQDPATGRRGNLLVIHCRDARDMGGHFPPNCYPGNGWTMEGGARMHQFEVWGRRVPVAEYRFRRREMAGDVSAAIYNFFILPTGAMVTSMDEVRSASGDYRMVPYGAAQFQVVFDGQTPEADRLAVAGELLAPLAGVVEILTLNARPQGGGEVVENARP